MSVKVMSGVWADADVKGGTLLVLLALADFANDEGECWPSLDTLAHKARLSRSQTKSTVATLERDGFIEVDRGTGRETSRYRIVAGGGRKLTPSTDRQGVRNRPTNLRKLTPRGSESVDPLHSKEPSKNRHRTTTEPDAAVDGKVLAFQLYEETVGTLDPHVAQKIQEAIDEGWTEECQRHCFAAASEANARSWRYVAAIIREHKAHGCYAASPGGRGSSSGRGRSSGGPNLDASRQFAARASGG